MSNRYSSQNRNFQKKFVPRANPQKPKNQTQTLSNSLRNPNDDARIVPSTTSRVTMGDGGRWEPTIKGNFVIYLPHDEAVASGLGPDKGGLDPIESQRVVDLLNRELSRLLKLKPRDFWKEVASDTSLHVFLESFLKFRNRWYDFPYRGVKGKVAGLIVGEFELCRRVFMVLYRISSNRDPGAKVADSLSPKDHTALLQEKKFLDLPKLLDICAIYGHENEDLTGKLIVNAMKAQPNIHDDFPRLIYQFLSLVYTMHQRCSSSWEVLLSSSELQDTGSNRVHSDYLEVMDFINDAVVSMDSLVNSYRLAAVLLCSPAEMSYGNEELLSTLARIHDSLIPSLRRGFHIIVATGDDAKKEMSSDFLSNVLVSLKMLSTRITNLGWKLLYFCYLTDEPFGENYSSLASVKMFPANVEDPVIRADILIQSLRDLSRDHLVPEGHIGRTFLQDIEKNHCMMARIELLLNTGWLSMDDEQIQFLSGIMSHPLEAKTKEKCSRTSQMASNERQADEDTAIIESKISQIKDLFPDYGKGFLAACLEAYSQNTEEVIQRILDGTLHKELQSLDISLENTPPSKSMPSLSGYDKGKGKLEEPVMPPSKIMASTVIENQTGSSSSSSSSLFGRFIRKNTDDIPDSQTLDSRSRNDKVKTAAFASQLEYEDEYDDSFDDLGMSVGDSGLDDTDMLETHQGDGGSSSSDATYSKWNSRKKPQFYVKDGKNYSYKVDNSVAVANYNEAVLVTQTQRGLIHGLGRGGNIRSTPVKRLTESNEEQVDLSNIDNIAGRGGHGNSRGRGRRGDVRITEANEEQADGSNINDIAGRGGFGNSRGRGRRGGGRNHSRRDKAMSKHFSGLPSHYNG